MKIFIGLIHKLTFSVSNQVPSSFPQLHHTPPSHQEEFWTVSLCMHLLAQATILGHSPSISKLPYMSRKYKTKRVTSVRRFDTQCLF
ncbi:hypothetical protein JHK82_043752 [Glycine max]|uniref:Uncharacterized protein n=2 Tax=Glycine subgen. Soja TaxID=1462606 RepID=A0A0R0G612_SOYBN|nr:hypothetical protein JHK86_043629 [Glycine max]RZB66188.1 hypothetical protein D0Y65_042009 [Glycine soja]KAG4957915.1 hypothetical protein JHK85_044295 [Glycine max]KAG5106782.1 hypothetical protein JHK82_043752 [Glycine max]KAG5117708.1 hypothetical protein JHK84_043821 [Glycine max]